MELKSLKKKFKDKHFAAGCDREVIKQGAEMLGWELDLSLIHIYPVVSTCGNLSIVECDHFCDLGEITPDEVEIPGMFIDMILK